MFSPQLTLIELDMLKAIETHELVVYMWEHNSPGEWVHSYHVLIRTDRRKGRACNFMKYQLGRIAECY